MGLKSGFSACKRTLVGSLKNRFNVTESSIIATTIGKASRNQSAFGA